MSFQRIMLLFCLAFASFLCAQSGPFDGTLRQGDVTLILSEQPTPPVLMGLPLIPTLPSGLIPPLLVVGAISTTDGATTGFTITIVHKGAPQQTEKTIVKIPRNSASPYSNFFLGFDKREILSVQVDEHKPSAVFPIKEN